MKELKVEFANGQWEYTNADRVRKYPMELMAVNRAKFEAKNQRPCHLVLKDKDGNVTLDINLDDSNVNQI